MKKRKYDLVLGLGVACSCTETLRAARLQFLSFPFDWISPKTESPADYEHELRARADFLADGFADWLRKEDLRFMHRYETGRTDVYFNRRLRQVFNHDFPAGSDFDAQFPAVAAKYDRRARRLMGILRAAKRVLLVRIDRPEMTVPTSSDDCLYALDVLARAFPRTHFDFFLLSNSPGIPPERRQETRVAENFTRVSFDYTIRGEGAKPFLVDLHVTSRLLAERFAVADYRTLRERLARRLLRLKRTVARKAAALSRLFSPSARP